MNEEILEELLTGSVWDEQKTRDALARDNTTPGKLPGGFMIMLNFIAAVPFNEERTRFLYDWCPDALYMSTRENEHQTPVHMAIMFDNVQLVEFYVKQVPNVVNIRRHGKTLATYAVEQNAGQVCAFLAKNFPEMFDVDCPEQPPIVTAFQNPYLNAFDAIFKHTKHRLHLPQYDRFYATRWHRSCEDYNKTKNRCCKLAAALSMSRQPSSNDFFFCESAFRLVSKTYIERDAEAYRGAMVAVASTRNAFSSSFQLASVWTRHFVYIIELTGARYLNDVDCWGVNIVHKVLKWGSEINGELLRKIAAIDISPFFALDARGRLPFLRRCVLRSRNKEFFRQILQLGASHLFATKGTLSEYEWIKAHKLAPHARCVADFIVLYQICNYRQRCKLIRVCPRLLLERLPWGVKIIEHIVVHAPQTVCQVAFKMLQFIDLDSPSSNARTVRSLLADKQRSEIQDALIDTTPERRERYLGPTSMAFNVLMGMKLTQVVY